MKLLERLIAWLDTWQEYPSHAITLIIIILILGSMAVIATYIGR